MKALSRFEIVVIGCLTVGWSSSIGAQSSNAPPIIDGTKRPADSREIQFFVGQRFWVATWDQAYLDAEIVVPNPQSPQPVVQQSSKRALSGLTVAPMTAFGMRYNDWTVSATLMPRTKFTTDGVALGDAVRRNEADLSVGYALSPNLSGSIVYKTGTIDQLTTKRHTSLTGVSGGYKIKGLLFGISGSAQLQGPFALYGTFAIGPARQTTFGTGASDPTIKGTYQISEVGLAYRLTDDRTFLGFKNLSMQLGYRSQAVSLRDVPFATFSMEPVPTVVSIESRKLNSTTQGLLMGVVAAF